MALLVSVVGLKEKRFSAKPFPLIHTSVPPFKLAPFCHHPPFFLVVTLLILVELKEPIMEVKKRYICLMFKN
jgi:hypothetical protein